MFILDSVLNILFFIDIIVNFNTAVLKEDLDIVDDRGVTFVNLIIFRRSSGLISEDGFS